MANILDSNSNKLFRKLVELKWPELNNLKNFGKSLM